METQADTQELIKALATAYKKNPRSIVNEARKHGLFIFDEVSLGDRDHISAQQYDPYPIDFQDVLDEEQFYAIQSK